MNWKIIYFPPCSPNKDIRSASTFFGTRFQLETTFKKTEWVMFHRLFLVCRNTSSLLFLLHLRHCWGASSLPSLEADVIQWVAEEGVGGEDGDEGGDGVGKEYCPG